MLPVVGRPFVSYLIENIVRFGFDDILLLSGDRSQAVQSTIASEPRIAPHGNYKIRFVSEREPLGTAGALRNALDLLAPEFLLLDGDSFFDFNLLDLPVFPAREPWRARMALRQAADTGRSGVVELGPDGTIAALTPRPGRGAAGLIGGGVYWLRRDVVGGIPAGECSLEGAIFPALAREGHLRGKVYDGFFLDIGMPGSLQEAASAMYGQRRRPAVFFDRDGVLNHDEGHTHRPADFRWIEGAQRAVRLVNDRGWFAFVVTNQSGVARGLYEEKDVVRLHQWMNEDLRRSGAHIDDFRYCPYHPDGTVARYAVASDWRKPDPGMLLNLIKIWPLDLTRSVIIGDKDTDMQAGRQAGIRSRKFTGGDLGTVVEEELAGHATGIAPGRR